MKLILEKVFRPKLLLVYILAFAFLIRIAGVGYGLPLWLIDDEPPFTLAALKMIQLKTLILASDLEEFKTVLYYPPYLSYLYLLPFSILLGIKYLLFSGGQEQFIYYLTGDLSQFFLIARFLNVLLGVAAIGLLYKVAAVLFRNKTVGLAAAFFLATSLAHSAFSFVGRHWLPVSFLFVLILFFLTRDGWSFRKRYALAILSAGFGAGVSSIAGIFLLFIFFWYFLYEKMAIGNILKDRFFYLVFLLLAGLLILPGIIYPSSFGFGGDLTLFENKSVAGILASPFLFLKPLVVSEPVLTGLAIIGLWFVFYRRREIFWPFAGFIYFYSAVFYLFFRYEYRFAIVLLPLLAVLAAFGAVSLFRKINRSAAIIIFSLLALVLLSVSARFGYLSLRNDSRIHLREWLQANIPDNAKVLVYARLMRLPSNPEAIAEQRSIDALSLRKVDIAEENLSVRDEKFFHALNLYSVSAPDFFENLEKYASANGYEYLVMSETDFQRNPERFGRFREIAEKSTLLKSFGSRQETYSLSVGQLAGQPFYLFNLEEFGPAVSIYKIKL